MAPALHAGFVAYSDPAYLGNQAWGGELAQGFNVLSPIRVTALGVFDSGNAGFIGTVSEAIFSVNLDATFTQISNTVAFSGTDLSTAGTLSGGDRFLNLATPLVLGPGTYEIATNWPSDYNGNSICNPGGCGYSVCNIVGCVFSVPGGIFTAPTLNTGAAAISFIGSGLHSAGLVGIPLNSTQNFNAGSFQFDDVVLPEAKIPTASMRKLPFSPKV